MKICILTIATNKYIDFIEPLYNSISENFLNGHEINCILFTNHECETSDNVRVCQIGQKPKSITRYGGNTFKRRKTYKRKTNKRKVYKRKTNKRKTCKRKRLYRV